MTTVVLPEALTIAAVRALRTELLEAFDAPPPFTLDGRLVDDIDGAGVQLLLSAARELATRDLVLAVNPSPTLRRTMEQLAIIDRFALDTGASA